jgi:hypothetical protein
MTTLMLTLTRTRRALNEFDASQAARKTFEPDFLARFEPVEAALGDAFALDTSNVIDQDTARAMAKSEAGRAGIRLLVDAVLQQNEAAATVERTLDRYRDACDRLQEVTADRDRWRARCQVTPRDVKDAGVTDRDAEAVLKSKGWTASEHRVEGHPRGYFIDLKDADGYAICSLYDEPRMIVFPSNTRPNSAISPNTTCSTRCVRTRPDGENSIMADQIDPDSVALFDAFERCDAPIGNYYGTPSLVRFQGRWLMALGTAGGSAFVVVSDVFAAAWLAEFDGTAKRDIYVNVYAFDRVAAPWPGKRAEDFDPELDGPERDANVARLASELRLATERQP